MKSLPLSLSVIALALAATFSGGAFAQAKAAETMVLAASAPGQAAAARVSSVSAVVVAIDAATRTVTLKGAKGKVVDIVAGPEIRNFDQIKVGDTVTAEYTQALSLELKKGGNSIRESGVKTAAASAPAGARPAGAIGHQVTILADVVAVDAKKGVVTLRGPKGNEVDLAVQDPGQLKLIKKGDQVEAIYSEAVAVAVTATPAGAKPAAKPASAAK